MSPTQAVSYRLTVAGTTDLHGHVLDWDYYRDRPAGGRDERGLAQVATVIRAVRAEREPGTVLTVDAGDTVQGSLLAYYFGVVEPVDAPGGPEHPMAAGMNAIGFDAACVGNHEFNYGLPLLRAFERQVRHPLLAANALAWGTDDPAFPPFVLRPVTFGDGTRVTVGIVGLVTPGCAIWDRGHLEGRVAFDGVVERGARVVPAARAAGADVVVVACHSGASPSSSYGDALPWPENAAQQLAEEVEGIDAILVGHAHVEIGERFVANRSTGRPVLLCEPLCWGMRVAVMDLDLVRSGGSWQVTRAASTLRTTTGAVPDPAVTAAVATAHDRVRAYVNRPVGRCAATMTCASSRVQDTPALTFVAHVQAAAVAEVLADDPAAAGLPVLSLVSPFSRRAVVPAGAIAWKDVASLYPYDNTLLAVRLSGRGLRAHLEHAARYYRTVRGAGPFRADELTNAETDLAPRGTPDYNLDVAHGLAAPLSYDVDLARPPGDRVVGLAYDGAAVGDDDVFAVAVNNYRQAGGGGYTGVAAAPVLYDGQRQITPLLADFVAARGGLDPARFTARRWRLVADGEPLVVLA